MSKPAPTLASHDVPQGGSPTPGRTGGGRTRELSTDAAYRAIETHDARFDGRLYVGVTSTRVYCRPVCRVRTPHKRHCRFFGSAAGAEAAGFRPCRRCRPEMAPGVSLVDSPHTLAAHAARLIERAARDGEPLPMPALARRLGVTDRHLRRIFQDTHGVSPLAFLTTQRLLFAKHLLSDTDVPVTQVALLSGFSSLRRFNAAFASHYRLTPREMRREPAEGDTAAARASACRRAAREPAADAAAGASSWHDDGITLRLAYRPPYDTRGVLAFLARRSLPGIECVDGQRLAVWRSLRVDTNDGSRVGWVGARLEPARAQVELRASASLLPVIGRVIERARHALDLDAEPAAMEGVLADVPAPAVAGLRVPGSFDPFETTVRIILGQQVTVAAARTLALRVVDRFGTPLDGAPPGVQRLFPSPAALAAADDDALGSLGIVRARIRAIRAVAQAIVDGRLRLDATGDLEATLTVLRDLPGVGEWTVQLIAMRVLAWPDAFPASDIGVLNALGHRDPKRAQAQSMAWTPWRSYAAMALWQSLESGT
jgi:AraC family transcriptional regulator of adaptative response / DNA-3-methyladenine glycosylase II